MRKDNNDLGRPGGLSSLRDPAPAGLAHTASIPDAAKIGWLERRLKARREERMLRTYGGLQWCPWCKQCAQDNNGDWRFDPWPEDIMYDRLTCGVCGGTSLWIWGMGMHFQRALDHPAQAIEAGTAKTAGLGPQDESAVGETDAPHTPTETTNADVD